MINSDAILISHSTQKGNGSHGFLEAVYCKQVADRVAAILKRHQLNVHLVDPAGDFIAHYNLAKKIQAKRSLVIHTNAITSNSSTWQVSRSGAVVYCYDAADAGRASTILSHRVAAQLQQIWQKPVPVLTKRFLEVRVPGCSTAYAELGYHDNPADQEKLLLEQNRFSLSMALAILDDTGTAYDGFDMKPEQPEPLYTIQAGAFRNRTYAEQYLQAIHAAGFTGAYIKGVQS